MSWGCQVIGNRDRRWKEEVFPRGQGVDNNNSKGNLNSGGSLFLYLLSIPFLGLLDSQVSYIKLRAPSNWGQDTSSRIPHMLRFMTSCTPGGYRGNIYHHCYTNLSISGTKCSFTRVSHRTGRIPPLGHQPSARQLSPNSQPPPHATVGVADHIGLQ